MADVRGKGIDMDKDIRSYLAKELEYTPFLRKYGIEIIRIVEDNFENTWLDIVEEANGDNDKLKSLFAPLSNKITMFSAAFL